MLAIPYGVKVIFCFLTQMASICPTGHLWPSSLLLYNTYGMNNNSKCMFVGAPHRPDTIMILGGHLKTNGASFQGTVGAK